MSRKVNTVQRPVACRIAVAVEIVNTALKLFNELVSWSLTSLFSTAFQ